MVWWLVASARDAKAQYGLQETISRTIMTNLQKLQAWIENEKKTNGLVDIDIFPGDNPDIEKAAGDLLALLTGSDQGEDITDQLL